MIIFASIFQHSYVLLFVLLSLFGWIGLSDYVRAEFLRNRQLEYVNAARAMGLSGWSIATRHILPNSLTSVITFLPFRMSGGVVALASLDFLGLGVTAPAPSLGHLLAQGKENLDAWWISLATFSVLGVTLLLLTFTGEALRNALDNRISDAVTSTPHLASPATDTALLHPGRVSAQGAV
jgi:microcin C transport system permease protein